MTLAQEPEPRELDDVQRAAKQEADDILKVDGDRDATGSYGATASEGYAAPSTGTMAQPSVGTSVPSGYASDRVYMLRYDASGREYICVCGERIYFDGPTAAGASAEGERYSAGYRGDQETQQSEQDQQSEAEQKEQTQQQEQQGTDSQQQDAEQQQDQGDQQRNDPEAEATRSPDEGSDNSGNEQEGQSDQQSAEQNQTGRAPSPSDQPNAPAGQLSTADLQDQVEDNAFGAEETASAAKATGESDSSNAEIGGNIPQ